MTIPRKGVDINSKAPTARHCPILDYFGEAFHLYSLPAMWGNARMEFITRKIPKISEKAASMAILVTDGVGGGNLGMVTTFCYHNQVMLVASDAISALHQCNSLEPSVVIVRRYTNTPYFSQWSSFLLYLDMHTLSGVLPLPNSHWTSYVYTGCSPSQTLRWSCLKRR